MKFCARCGSPVQPDDLFCSECGARQVVPASSEGRPRGSAFPPLAELPSGTVLRDRYEIIRRVGGGGMGNVYQARDLHLQGAVRAVKEMIEMFSDPTLREKAIRDFQREARLLASLRHPSIPVIYDHFVEGGRYYLVMEFIAGGDLATRQQLVGGRFDELTVTMWAIQICDVLDYLHTRQPPIIYRDLKPANVMVDPEANRVVLIDFGIARVVAPREKGVTAIGTMGYAPPELFAGQAEPRSDIYSLGATMFHLLTGVDPRDQPLLIFDFTRNPTPRQLNPELTPEMERILMRAVAHAPEDRFASAREMKGVLEAHLALLRERYGDRVEHAYRMAFGDLVRRVGSDVAPRIGPAVETVYCSYCGVSIGADDLYCAYCGARQPIEVEPIHASARLLVLDARSGDAQAMHALLKESNLIGRADPISGVFPDVDLSPYDPGAKVSRRHARIWRAEGRYWIEDLASVNGTFLNGRRLLPPRTPHVLQDGDRLRIGEVSLLFRHGE